MQTETELGAWAGSLGEASTGMHWPAMFKNDASKKRDPMHESPYKHEMSSDLCELIAWSTRNDANLLVAWEEIKHVNYV